MTQLTERYLAAAMRGIPEGQRTDVERELRSSIADALEDRVSAGEDRVAAEKAVLEGLGDPVRLAAGISGRPLYLIGPDLFVQYRQLLVLLLSIVMPIVGIVQVAVAIGGGDDLIGALMAGIGGAWTVGLHIFFWVTITFAAVERVDAVRDAREEISSAAGRWTVDRLPALPSARISASDLVGEVLSTALGIGGLLYLNSVVWFTDAAGDPIPLFNPDLWSLLIPTLVAIMAAIGGPPDRRLPGGPMDDAARRRQRRAPARVLGARRRAGADRLAHQSRIRRCARVATARRSPWAGDARSGGRRVLVTAMGYLRWIPARAPRRCQGDRDR